MTLCQTKEQSTFLFQIMMIVFQIRAILAKHAQTIVGDILALDGQTAEVLFLNLLVKALKTEHSLVTSTIASATDPRFPSRPVLNELHKRSR